MGSSVVRWECIVSRYSFLNGWLAGVICSAVLFAGVGTDEKAREILSADGARAMPDRPVPAGIIAHRSVLSLATLAPSAFADWDGDAQN